MNLSDINKRIVLVAGKVCSGKGHYCSANYPDYTHLPVSSVVRRVASATSRSELGATKSLEPIIIDSLIAEIDKHPRVVVDGIRQPGIIKALQRHYGDQITDIIWLDVPEETLRSRFASRGDAKDDISFDDAVQGDARLGLGDVEDYIRQNGRVVTNN